MLSNQIPSLSSPTKVWSDSQHHFTRRALRIDCCSKKCKCPVWWWDHGTLCLVSKFLVRRELYSLFSWQAEVTNMNTACVTRGYHEFDRKANKTPIGAGGIFTIFTILPLRGKRVKSMCCTRGELRTRRQPIFYVTPWKINLNSESKQRFVATNIMSLLN